MGVIMNSNYIINSAIEFATKLHEGQVRRDGKPYISHPVSVCEKVRAYLKGRSHIYGTTEFLVTALFHDICEDVELYKNNPEQLANDFLAIYHINEGFDKERLIANLHDLTKREGESYLDFILRAGKNHYSRRVKIADIQHNLSDLKPDNKLDKLRIDKYKLALYILEN